MIKFQLLKNKIYCTVYRHSDAQSLKEVCKPLIAKLNYFVVKAIYQNDFSFLLNTAGRGKKTQFSKVKNNF